MNSVNSHNRIAHYDYTNRTSKHYVNRATWGSVLVMMLSAAACGERLGEGAGDSFGDTATSGELGDGDGDPGDPPIPSGETRCVERDPGIVTCWVEWEATKARVLLPCEAQAAVDAGVWTAAFDDDLEQWGSVSCHGVVATDYKLCLYSASRVLLTETIDGWVPEVSATVCGLPEVAAPCVDECLPLSPGCECSPLGECAVGLDCRQGICEVCPPGEAGCFCHADETCDAGLVCTGFVCE